MLYEQEDKLEYFKHGMRLNRIVTRVERKLEFI